MIFCVRHLRMKLSFILIIGRSRSGPGIAGNLNTQSYPPDYILIKSNYADLSTGFPDLHLGAPGWGMNTQLSTSHAGLQRSTLCRQDASKSLEDMLLIISRLNAAYNQLLLRNSGFYTPPPSQEDWEVVATHSPRTGTPDISLFYHIPPSRLLSWFHQPM
jgi:hypothetical protein